MASYSLVLSKGQEYSPTGFSLGSAPAGGVPGNVLSKILTWRSRPHYTEKNTGI